MFPVSDGWCTPSLEGIGDHCFGDFWTSIRLFDDPSSPWSNAYGLHHPRAPSGMLPEVPSWAIWHVTGSPRLALATFLAALVIALAIPALAIVRSFSPSLRWLPFMLIGVASLPTIMSLDRGASSGFAVPFMVWAVWAFFRNRPTQLLVAVVAAAAVRPQYVLLALRFLPWRDFRRILLACLGVGATVLLGFAVWPGDRLANISAWWNNTTAFSAYTPLSAPDPANYSAAKSAWTLLDIGNHLLGPIASVASSLQASLVNRPSLVGIVLAVVTTALLWVYGSRVNPFLVTLVVLYLPMAVPGVSWSYYSVFVPVLAAAVLLNPRRWWVRPTDDAWLTVESGRAPGVLDEPAAPRPRWRILVVATLSLSIVPLPVPSLPDAVGDGLIVSNLGLLWFVVALASLVSLVAEGRRRPDPLISDQHATESAGRTIEGIAAEGRPTAH